MRRISKKVREEAALILQVCASNSLGTLDAAIALGLISTKCASSESLSLARRCFYNDAAPWTRGRSEMFAYAESLLRTGWTP